MHVIFIIDLFYFVNTNIQKQIYNNTFDIPICEGLCSEKNKHQWNVYATIKYEKFQVKQITVNTVNRLNNTSTLISKYCALFREKKTSKQLDEQDWTKINYNPLFYILIKSNDSNNSLKDARLIS